MTEVRDWQKDMRKTEIEKEQWAVLNIDTEPLDRTIHWLIQAAEWKAEAEKWRIEALRKYPTPDAYDAACAALHKHRERAEQLFTMVEQQGKEINRLQHVNRRAMEREQMLRDELDGTIPLIEAAGLLVRASRLKNLLASLYSEKERKV